MLLLSLHLMSNPAAALDVDTFSFAGSALDAQGGLQVEAPTVGWPGGIYGGLGLVYAHNQLVRVYADDTASSLVQDSFATHVLGGYNVLGKVRLDLDLPLYPYVGGPDDPSINGVSSGDARIRGVVAIPLGEASKFHLAVIPALSLPTGEPLAYTGSGGVGAGLSAAGGFAVTDAFAVNANVGVHATQRSSIGDQVFGSGLDLGLGLNYAVKPEIGVGAELTGLVDIAGASDVGFESPWELHAYGRYGKVSGVQALVGVGTGLVNGVGAPDFRALASVGYRFAGKEPIYDLDGDGIFDDVDKCIDRPEDKDNFEDSDGCPDNDNDRDGILDAGDRCPNDAEDLDSFEDADGCPEPDNDKDGTLDREDECPLEPGPANTKGCPDRDGDTLIDSKDSCPDEAGPLETNGCPDRDKDLVPDKRDKCPDEPKDPREDPARSDGCPKRVFVSVEKIEILDKIYFDTNKTTIKKQSYALLHEIATVINNNPDILKIEVAGHTDSVGNDNANLKLSQGRAESVVKHLTTKEGVAADRLTGVGYGESKPIDTNATEAGRGNNRRVEFVIKGFASKGPLGALPVTNPPVAPAATPAAAPAAPAPAPAAPAKKPEDNTPLDPSKAAEKPGTTSDPFGLDDR